MLFSGSAGVVLCTEGTIIIIDDILMSPSREKLAVQRITDAAKIKDVLEVVPDGVIVTERDGSIRFANQAALRMFGYSTDELVGQSVEILVPSAVREHHRELRERFNSAPTVRSLGSGLKLTALRRNGEEFPVEIRTERIEYELERPTLTRAVMS